MGKRWHDESCLRIKIILRKSELGSCVLEGSITSKMHNVTMFQQTIVRWFSGNPNKLQPLKKTCIVFQGYQWLDWVPLGEAREISCWICGSVWGWWFSNVLCVVFEHLILISLQKGCNLCFLVQVETSPRFSSVMPTEWVNKWVVFFESNHWVGCCQWQCTGQRVHPRKTESTKISPQKTSSIFRNAYYTILKAKHVSGDFSLLLDGSSWMVLQIIEGTWPRKGGFENGGIQPVQAGKKLSLPFQEI